MMQCSIALLLAFVAMVSSSGSYAKPKHTAARYRIPAQRVKEAHGYRYASYGNAGYGGVSAYGHGNAYGHENVYGQGNAYGHGNAYGNGNAYGHGNAYGNGNAYGHGNVAYGHGNAYGGNHQYHGKYGSKYDGRKIILSLLLHQYWVKCYGLNLTPLRRCVIWSGKKGLGVKENSPPHKKHVPVHI